MEKEFIKSRTLVDKYKMNKRVLVSTIIIGLLLIITLPNIKAEAELSFPFNQDIDLRRPCFNNGTYCSAAALCNMSVNYPKGEILINNNLTTNQIGFHNITIFASSVNQLGVYSASMICCDGNACGADTFQFEVTGDGLSSNTFPLEFSLLILSFVFIIVGFSHERLRMFKYLGGIFAMVMGVVTLYPGYSGINYSTIQGLGLGSVAIALGFYFLIEDSFSRKEQVQTFEQNPEEEEFDGRYNE